jgi:flagellar motor switch protein FliM
MTEKILSQDEINALLQGMQDGKVDTASQEAMASGVMPYDFANQDRIIRGRMPMLEIVNDHFSRFFRNTLSMSLRKMIDVSVTGIQMVKFGEFIRTLPIPSSIHLFRMDPLRGHSILVLDAKLVFTLVDVFLGGSGKTTFRVEAREFTSIESRLIQKIVGMIFTELEKAWNAVYPISIQYVRSEINPQFVSIVTPSDLVMTIPFGVELDQFKGTITVCIPYSNIEPIKAKLYSGYQNDPLEADPDWIERFLSGIKSTDVEMKVELGRGSITVGKLLDLKVGEVLPLGKEVSEPLVAFVEGVPKFKGRPGIYGASKAFQVEQKISP